MSSSAEPRCHPGMLARGGVLALGQDLGHGWHSVLTSYSHSTINEWGGQTSQVTSALKASRTIRKTEGLRERSTQLRALS